MQSAFSIRLSFDKATDRYGRATQTTAAGQAGLCLRLIRHSTLEALGAEPKCAWHGESQLFVDIGPDSVVELGDAVQLQEGRVRTANGYSLYSAADVLNQPLEGPSLTVVPVPVLRAPHTLPACLDLDMADDGSTGAAGYPQIEHIHRT
jgi:hypothetical protein